MHTIPLIMGFLIAISFLTYAEFFRPKASKKRWAERFEEENKKKDEF